METTEIKPEAHMLEHKECVEQAIAEIFRSTCGIELKPHSAQEPETLNEDAIMAFLTLAGDVEWSIFLGLSRGAAENLAAKFAGFEIPFDSEDMGDAVGEMANIFVGETKTRLLKKGLKVEMSVPNVVRAESIHIVRQREMEIFKSNFISPAGMVWTEVIAKKIAI